MGRRLRHDGRNKLGSCPVCWSQSLYAVLSGSSRACAGRRGILVCVRPEAIYNTSESLTNNRASRSLIFYPISALLTIFCSILQNPLDPRSRGDLDRLNMAVCMMERIFVRKLSENEIIQIKLVADFVTELKQLAQCAIDKAWREQSSASLLPKWNSQATLRGVIGSSDVLQMGFMIGERDEQWKSRHTW